MAVAGEALTPAEFSAALASLGWSQRHLVSLLECDTNLPTRWARGTAVIPPSIGKWLDRLVACHERYPPPDDWRVYVYE